MRDIKNVTYLSVGTFVPSSSAQLRRLRATFQTPTRAHSPMRASVQPAVPINGNSFIGEFADVSSLVR
jgi:hypothetical protein